MAAAYSASYKEDPLASALGIKAPPPPIPPPPSPAITEPEPAAAQPTAAAACRLRRHRCPARRRPLPCECQETPLRMPPSPPPTAPAPPRSRARSAPASPSFRPAHSRVEARALAFLRPSRRCSTFRPAPRRPRRRWPSREIGSSSRRRRSVSGSASRLSEWAAAVPPLERVEAD